MSLLTSPKRSPRSYQNEEVPGRARFGGHVLAPEGADTPIMVTNRPQKTISPPLVVEQIGVAGAKRHARTT
ncbi:MAG TPA: hypothetical protein QF901_07355, partial [Gammaproteobacteria bacterium]|nr:hypothetical protein [Gammaproteobacteria bacterium]